MSKKDFYIFFIISFIICGGILYIGPHLTTRLSVNNFYLTLFTPYIGLLLIGYYIENRMAIQKEKIIKIIFPIIIILSVLINTLLTYYEKTIHPGYYLFYDNVILITITLPAIALFIYFKVIFKNLNNKLAIKIINIVSSHTFIIYLIHTIIIKESANIYNALIAKVPTQIGMYIYELYIFVIAFVIAFILKKIPYLKKIF